MKKTSTSILFLCMLTLNVFSQECAANAGELTLPFSCLPNSGEGSIVSEISGFTVEPSGTSTHEFILTSPPTELGEEVVLGVNRTGTFDLSMHPVTETPMPTGEYGITVFAYNSEDLDFLVSTNTIQDLIGGCENITDEPSLEEVLNCISELGLVMGELTIDLVISSFLETLAPILLMEPMCYNFGETQYFQIVDDGADCIVGIEDIIFSSLKVLYDPSTSRARVDSPFFEELKQIVVFNEIGKAMPFSSSAMEFDFSGFPKGMYFVNVQTDEYSQTRKLMVY